MKFTFVQINMKQVSYTRDLSIRACFRGKYKLMFYLTTVNKILRHCHTWLAVQ